MKRNGRQSEKREMFKNAGTNTGHLCKLDIEPKMKWEEKIANGILLHGGCYGVVNIYLGWCFIFYFSVFNSFVKLSVCSLPTEGLAEHSKKLKSPRFPCGRRIKCVKCNICTECGWLVPGHFFRLLLLLRYGNVMSWCWYECMYMRMCLSAWNTPYFCNLSCVSLLTRLAHKAVDARLSLSYNTFSISNAFSVVFSLSLSRSLPFYIFFRMWWIRIMKETSSVKHDYSLACKYESKNVTFLSIRFNCAKLIFPHKWIGKERMKSHVCVWESDVTHTHTRAHTPSRIQ